MSLLSQVRLDHPMVIPTHHQTNDINMQGMPLGSPPASGYQRSTFPSILYPKYSINRLIVVTTDPVGATAMLYRADDKSRSSGRIFEVGEGEDGVGAGKFPAKQATPCRGLHI